MRSVRTMVIAAILACTVGVYGASVVVYTVETGGNNHASDWENNTSPMPAYTSGVTDGSTQVTVGQDLNWAVRVSVGGSHDGEPGNGMPVLGAANLVFDLAVLMADHATAVADLGAAPMLCNGGVTPSTPGAANCAPTDKGFWSSINDGDQDGIRGAALQDIWGNAALSISIYNTLSAPAQLKAVSDDQPNGPNFDYGWYPTANHRGGIDLDGTKTVNTTIDKGAALDGMLVGFGAGYKKYDYTNYRPGVGLYQIDYGACQGFGADVLDPENPAVPERPLFEGQISTKGMAPGTYYLKVIPSANGNNILQGNVIWDDLDGNYGGAGSFAAKANSAIPLAAQANGVKFVVLAAPLVITTTCPLPGGTVGVLYSQVLAATGGSTPYTWSISGGALPGGLNLVGDTISGTPTASGTFNFTIRVTGSDSAYAEKACSITVLGRLTSMSARKLFYNNSYYDNNGAGIDTGTGTKSDNAAVDTGGLVSGVTYPAKTPLLTGGGASTFANWTGYTKGINGLIYEVLVGDGKRDPLASDFAFVNAGKSATGTTVVTPNNSASVVLVAGDPVNQRKVRLYFTFADGSLVTTWLKVTVGMGFGLAANEVHYWGNAPGETGSGNVSPNITVAPADEIAIKLHPTTTFSRSKVWDPFDITKNSLAEPADQIYVRTHGTTSFTCLKFITK